MMTMDGESHGEAAQLASALIAEHAGDAHLVAGLLADRFLADGELAQAQLFASVAQTCVAMIVEMRAMRPDA